MLLFYVIATKCTIGCVQISKSEFLCLVLISLALCLFVSVIPSCTYIVHSAGTKVELHIWNYDN